MRRAPRWPERQSRRSATADPRHLHRHDGLRISQARINRDQAVTRNEIEANQRARLAASAAHCARTLFAQIDSDRNGQISIDELIRANAQTGPVDGDAIMARLDASRDQRVTLVEYRILTLANFDRIDSDRDGVITPAEQRASTGNR